MYKTQLNYHSLSTTGIFAVDPWAGERHVPWLFQQTARVACIPTCDVVRLASVCRSLFPTCRPTAAVLGGTSLFGGKGNILPGAVIGIILITTIMNGLAMMNASPFIYTIVRGVIIFVAIALDSIGHKGELR